MPPLIDVKVDVQRGGALRPLRDADLGTALVHLVDDPVGIKGFVSDQAIEGDILDQGGNADRAEALSWHQHEPDEIAEGVGQREDFGGQPAFRLADGLTFGPPFAP